ncbi:Alb1-domain-containing protein [Microdochium trichocladiopsis]|uniref:Alb1-domain-containing protein n=1 Tax=Microdochium trichocladiopsis TaxID=1682393 RepID=A0A9P9BS03_9PEZI|nr:Alb1-domain-containing protein [Microdochium trichocladiopsis]KAH7033355.1 Alb1-domain-containing protein [Microdochium trichocladiopsis]
MGKGVIKKNRTPSVHSRAARRATDLDIDTDKSLKEVRPPSESVDHRPSILAIHQNAGVTKKAKKGRNLSSKARKRQEKSMDRAAAIMERTEHKVVQSKNRGRTVETRRKTWDDINKSIPDFANSAMPGDEDEWESDDSSEEAGQKKSGAAKPGATAVSSTEASKVPLPAEMEDIDDNIL